MLVSSVCSLCLGDHVVLNSFSDYNLNCPLQELIPNLIASSLKLLGFQLDNLPEAEGDFRYAMI